MADLRHRIPNRSALARSLGCDYSHVHNVLKGRTKPSVALAKRIEQATGGLIRWWEFFGEAPVPFVVEAALSDDTALVVALDEPGAAAGEKAEAHTNAHEALRATA